MKVELLELAPQVTDREHAEDVASRLDELMLQIACFFPRTDLWGRAVACVEGLLAPLSNGGDGRLGHRSGAGAGRPGAVPSAPVDG